MIVAWLCRLNHLNAEHVLLVDSFHSFESDIAYAIVPSNEEKSRTFKITLSYQWVSQSPTEILCGTYTYPTPWVSVVCYVTVCQPAASSS